jgi:hypothetical protein
MRLLKRECYSSRRHLGLLARGSRLSCALLCAALSSSCRPNNVTRESARDTANLFANGDFELGRPPWHDRRAPSRNYWHGFELSTAFASHGRTSALLRLNADESSPVRERVFIAGVVQEVRVPTLVDPATHQEFQEFPETISGQYRVENWRRRTAKQYLQFVVILWASDLHPDQPEETNVQIRYVLAGASTPPLSLSNARYMIVGSPEPTTGTWVPFSRDLRKDWLEQWGALPRRFEFLRILFEVRYDDDPNLTPGSMGDVYFDDLYLGPSALGATSGDDPQSSAHSRSGVEAR